ncbi:MAG: hypothetical protein EHM59_20900, partial [Betaproteobacteria bacterium]
MNQTRKDEDPRKEASGLEMRRARAEDLAAIVALLADDPLGRRRERYSDPLPASYREAFEAIDRDPNQFL